MTTFQLTLDEKVWADIDSVVEETDSNRIEFLKEAIEIALRQYRTRQLEKKHAEGYRKFPVQPGEFDVWDKLTVLPEWDQDWGDEA